MSNQSNGSMRFVVGLGAFLFLALAILISKVNEEHECVEWGKRLEPHVIVEDGTKRTEWRVVRECVTRKIGE